MSIRKYNVLRSDDYVKEREMDGRSGWYNGAQTTIKLQTFQGRCRDIHLHLSWISLSSADAQTQLARVYVHVYGTELPTQITVCQLMPLLCLICVRAPACVCVCICANTSVFVCLLAAPIRLASRLIAEGSASFSGPNHSQHSAMSSMPVTYRQHLFFVSFWLTSLLFLSSWHAQTNIHPLAPYTPFFCQEWFSLSVFNTRNLTGNNVFSFPLHWHEFFSHFVWYLQWQHANSVSLCQYHWNSWFSKEVWPFLLKVSFDFCIFF